MYIWTVEIGFSFRECVQPRSPKVEIDNCIPALGTGQREILFSRNLNDGISRRESLWKRSLHLQLQEIT